MQPNGYIKVKNYKKFQHYKNRRPPWIKLYISLLDDYEFLQLSDENKWYTVALYLLASQHENRIPNDPAFITNRIGAIQVIDLQPIMDAGFISICKHKARQVLAEGKQNDDGETETEAYKEEKSRDRYKDDFDLVWGMYPSRGDHSNPKLVAFKAWKVRLKEGVPTAHLMAAVKRYAQECADNGKIGTEHVMQACTFFGPNERWKEYHEKDRKAKAAVPVATEPLPDITPETREAQLAAIKKAKDELAAR